MSDPAAHPDLRVCAVCGRPADYADGAGYLHLADTLEGADDHPVVPVMPGEVHTVGSCDFCYGPNPGFVVPVRDFTYKNSPSIVTPDGVNRQQRSLGDWSACSDCAKLIERNDWNGVLRRVAANDDRAQHPEVLNSIRSMFRQVRANITGAVRPFDWPQPPERDQR